MTNVQKTFLNSNYVVIEYIDLIKSPYLMLLDILRKDEKLDEFFYMERVRDLDSEGLYEWYLNRKNQNFLIDLNRDTEKLSNEALDKFLENQMGVTDFIYTIDPLIFADSVRKIKSIKGLVQDVIIYFPFKTDLAKKNLEELYDMPFTFMSDFDKILDIAGSDSTYFLSDVEKIFRMKEKGCLKFSSVTIPVEYRYNRKNPTEWKFDYDELVEENLFKLSFLRACTYIEETEYDEGETEDEPLDIDEEENTPIELTVEEIRGLTRIEDEPEEDIYEEEGENDEE